MTPMSLSNIQAFIDYYDSILAFNPDWEKYVVDKKFSESTNFSADAFETMIDRLLQRAGGIEKNIQLDWPRYT